MTQKETKVRKMQPAKQSDSILNKKTKCKSAFLGFQHKKRLKKKLH